MEFGNSVPGTRFGPRAKIEIEKPNFKIKCGTNFLGHVENCLNRWVPSENMTYLHQFWNDTLDFITKDLRMPDHSPEFLSQKMRHCPELLRHLAVLSHCLMRLRQCLILSHTVSHCLKVSHTVSKM
jgi:hypothetical protein